jgi:hypothetical protein
MATRFGRFRIIQDELLKRKAELRNGEEARKICRAFFAFYKTTILLMVRWNFE